MPCKLAFNSISLQLIKLIALKTNFKNRILLYNAVHTLHVISAVCITDLKKKHSSTQTVQSVNFSYGILKICLATSVSKQAKGQLYMNIHQILI